MQLDTYLNNDWLEIMSMFNNMLKKTSGILTKKLMNFGKIIS